MVALFVSVLLLFGTWSTLRGGFAGSGPGLKISGFDPNALGLGGVAIAAAIWFFGWQYGLAFIGAILLHEYGHVAAYRVCGHADAKFRLIPLLGGVSISARIPSSHLQDLFITLMGAAGGLAPMMLLFAASDLLYPQLPALSDYLYIQASVIGFLGAFNLLPFWPLDGGRIVRLLTFTFAPRATRAVSILMSAAAAAAAVATRSYFLLFFVLIGWQGLIRSEQLIGLQRGMSKQSGVWALAAYLFTTATFLVVAWPILAQF